MHRNDKKTAGICLLITAALLLMAVNLHAQVEEKERTLTWANYKGRLPQKARFAATTVSRIVIVTTKPVNGIIVQPVYVWCEFSESQSWVNRSLLQLDAHKRLLEHEINHYRLNIICAKLIKKSISGDKSVPQKKLQELTARFTRIFDERNKRYDKETRHGSLLVKQLQWEKQIGRELASLQDIRLIRP